VTLESYRVAVAEYERAEARVKRFADARALAVLDLARSGWTLRRIAGELGITRARVCQLIGRARSLPDTATSAVGAVTASGVVLTTEMLSEASTALVALRREIRRQAADARTESIRILTGADALYVHRPADRRVGEWDAFRGLDPDELERLRSWWTDSPASAPELVADRIRDAMPALSQLGTDELLTRVWLHHTRVADAAGRVAQGKLPVTRRYSGHVDVDALAPGVAADGYNVTIVLGDDEQAVRHVAMVDAVRDRDEAYRALGDAVRCQHGPSPWSMTAESYTTEVLAIDAQLAGDDHLERSELDTRARRDELVPKLLDNGSDWPALHAVIVDTARIADLS
jgi:hypothetical protein